jgi:ribosomal protein S18 acetylase RimI-like enzyme
MLQIRRYEDADHEAMWDLNNLALDIVGAHPGQDYFADLHNINEVYLDNRGEFLLGMVDDQIVAMGAFKRTDDAKAEIVRMRIHPDFQRRGFGQALLSALVDRAKAMGYRALHLSTTVQQVAAQALYERNGFRQTGTDTYEQFKLLVYEKELS